MKKMTIDGNFAAAHVAYAFSEVAAIYPITPSSTMAELADEWASAGRKNLLGETLKIAEMQSEGGAAGAVHGSLALGALTTTFTASQGLLLMIPNMYKIAGELLPTVFHVSARALAAHALSIFGDHSDVMATRQTGFALLASGSVQEAMDLALVAHLSTLRSSIPFVHFFDGFRTSHEVQKIDAIEYDEMEKLLDLKDVQAFKKRALSPARPVQRGTAQNPDIYFQAREAANKYYNAVPAVVKEMMAKVSKLTGRNYNLFDYVGAPDATKVIVMMGSGSEAAHETIQYLNKKGEKVGLVKIRLFRPFSIEDFVSVLPQTVQKIAVLDRTKEAGSAGEPLYQDVCTALIECGKANIRVVGGRYGLGSKEFNPTHVKAVLDNLDALEPKNHFTVGINDDVSFTSIALGAPLNIASEETVSCKFYGLGSDGTVGANKNSIKIIGDHTDMFAQGYFVYDSKKSNGFTISHLRFGKEPIKSTYLINDADFIACHNSSYVVRYDMASDLKDGGIFLLNCSWNEKELETHLPAELKQTLARKKAKLYVIDAVKIAGEAGMGKHINVVMQAAFFKLANIIPYAKAEEYMKQAVEKTYGKKGPEVVKKNFDAIDNAISGLIEIKYPQSWATEQKGAKPIKTTTNKYFNSFVHKILAQKGDDLPVSSFTPDGTVPTATTQYEKRGFAISVPEWIKENCIQCNRCSFVCPHAVIRPVAANEEALKNAPAGFETAKLNGMPQLNYRIQVSPYDCTGCLSCINVCPAKEKALRAVPLEESIKIDQKNYEFAQTLPILDLSEKFKPNSVKGSQFKQPLFEFSGACGGCGETPYIKLVTQLFGSRMIIANATGCTSIYGGSAPSCPYTTNEKGEGPAWANSLFEDNAEYGFGMKLALEARKAQLCGTIKQVLEGEVEGTVKSALASWLENHENVEQSQEIHAILSKNLPAAIKAAKGTQRELLEQVQGSLDLIIKKSVWLFGGDGWAYDIDYGGLDHVLASGANVNVLVLDTEVYSNTGGQASKATPTGSVAKFAASGKRTKKKDLGLMAMSYGYVYVAQIAMGADYEQTVKAIAEAEAYDGPSLIIAYSTCINHGFDMSNGQAQTREAVKAGYWQLYRFNPALKQQGKNPFTLDSKDPTNSYQDFITTENRYKILKAQRPELAEALFKQAEQDAAERLATYKKLTEE